MKTLLLAAVSAALPLFAQLQADTGNLTVRIVYQGNPVASGCQIEYSTSIGYFNCGGSVTNVPVGNYTLYPNFSLLPQVPVTIAKGVTTQVDVELSPYAGIITGVIQVNGAPPTGSAFAFDLGQDRLEYGYTDGTSRFQFLAVPGTRLGMAAGNNFNAQLFPFTAMANTTVDVGTINATPYAPPASGSFTLRTLYHGQPVTDCLWMGWEVSNFDSVDCNGSHSQVSTGSHTLSSSLHPQITPVTFGVLDGQNTVVDVEISPWVGVITGIILVDGVPPQPASVFAYADFPNSATRGYSDPSGRFRFLSFAGPQTGAVVKNSLLVSLAFTAIAGSTVDLGTITSNHAPIGSVTVRALYKGQPVSDCIAMDFQLDNNWGFGCGGTQTGLPAGTYTLTENLHGLVTPVQVNVSDGQTTVVDVEISGWVGEITGTIKINGNIPALNTIYAMSEYPNFVTRGFTDTTGRFRFLAVGGAGTGDIVGNVLILRFGYAAVAGQTRDLGAVGLTTLNGAITAKNGNMPFKTWTIRLDNTGTLNSAENTQLDNLTLVQTAGAACTPAVTSTFPLVAGYLAPGTSATVLVDINFTGCAANARFTAKLSYSANGGAAFGTRSYALQLP